jgi:hypothetical protein
MTRHITLYYNTRYLDLNYGIILSSDYTDVCQLCVVLL